jgi:flagellar basal-body rod protein FlgB
MINLDNYLGIHEHALSLREMRSTQIANNIANVDTPNYKSRDINFYDVLNSQVTDNQASSLQTTDASHISMNDSFSTFQLGYRVPSRYSLDGNTVDREMEISEFTKNSVGYSASLSFLDGKLKHLMMSIKGE